MALSELAAIEAAYQALQGLDETGRRRALRWLSDALDTEHPLPEASAGEVAAGHPTSDSQSTHTAAPRPTKATRPARAARAERPARRAAASQPATRPGRRGRARAEVAQTPSTVERNYRRMPPVEDVLAAYQQTGSVNAMAEHFGVPGHTVQGWARRLRKEGYQIGRQR